MHAMPHCLLLLSALCLAQGEPPPAQTVALREHFGVSHPSQIVDFDLTAKVEPTSAFVIGPEGTEVPFQILRGNRIAVQSDLPAGAERTWKLFAGRAPAKFDGGVKVARGGRFFEIANGLTGVRIPVAPADLAVTPAAIQGILYRDGKWSATGPNRLSVAAKKMEVRFLGEGPLRVLVEVAYHFDRPALTHGNNVPIPAGEGYYRSTIEVQAGQPSILIEEETDCDISYSLNVYDGLEPSQARYRGHHSSSKELGREADGRQYRMWHERKPMDALVDLQYEKPMEHRPMAVWDPWVCDSGWYWMLYNTNAGEKGNLLGLFAGRPSRALGAAYSGVALFTKPEPRAAGITIHCRRQSPDTRVFPRVRFAWGLFVGTKGNDLADPYQVQPIARQMSLHAGVNLNKLHRLQLDFPDPKRGYGSLYMPADALKAMIQRLREDKAYHDRVWNAEPSARPLIEMWRDTTGEKVRKVVEETSATARDLLNAFVGGDGIYDFAFHYWHGGLAMSRKATFIDQALASDLEWEKGTGPFSAKHLAGRSGKRDLSSFPIRAKAAAVLFASVLWDDDFVPLHDGHGLNLGTANMPVQQENYRNLYAILLAEHPMMRERVKAIGERALADLRSTISDHGAHMACSHYVGASTGPLLSTLQQLKMAGLADAFKTEERLARFAEFYMHFLTPPEPRFGTARKVISIGDSSTEGSELFGQLATGYADVNPRLSARLMGAWHASGATHSGFHGTTLIKINEKLPAENPMLGSADFPGYYSVLRSGWGTPNETALWFLHGSYYRDHCHDDLGSFVLYALGAPISVDWGPIYYPRVGGGFMHNTILPESAIGHPWDKDSPPLDAGPRWAATDEHTFVSLPSGSYASARFKWRDGTLWERSVALIHPNESQPIIWIYDSTPEGPSATASKILTLNLMAEGKVETLADPETPPLRTYDHYKGTKELPSSGGAFPMQEGFDRFRFTGQWLADWDVYVYGDVKQGVLGNWAHAWHPGREQDEFRKANGRPFEERQHILRVRGNQWFGTLIVPSRKGQGPKAPRLTQEGGSAILTAENERTVVGYKHFSYRSPQRLVLATFTGSSVGVDGVVLDGEGAAELVLEGNRATLTASGPKGARCIRLPGAWKPKDPKTPLGFPGTRKPKDPEAPIVFRDKSWVLHYRSDAPQTIVLEKQ